MVIGDQAYHRGAGAASMPMLHTNPAFAETPFGYFACLA